MDRTRHPDIIATGIAPLMEVLSPHVDQTELRQVGRKLGHSNEIYELRFADGRTLVVKRGQEEWAAARFETARLVSTLLREDAGLEAPAPLDIPSMVGGRPLQAYWRIDRPTLAEVWPRLGAEARREALRTLAEVLTAVHDVRLDHWGELPPGSAPADGLAAMLQDDLGNRLAPAVAALWPSGLPWVQRLIEAAGEVEARREPAAPRLSHGDVHLGNVLCDSDGDGVRCVGLLDLDEARPAPPEADLARFEVLHGPLFEQALEGGHWRTVTDAYEPAPEPFTLAYFRAAHLANLGFHSACVGHHEHAQRVGAALASEVEGLAAVA